MSPCGIVGQWTLQCSPIVVCCIELVLSFDIQLDPILCICDLSIGTLLTTVGLHMSSFAELVDR